MKRKTKIVCTLGPSVDSEAGIKGLIDAGMNVARINCSHGDWDTRRLWVEWIRRYSPDIAPTAILVDLQGPKFRIGEIDDIREFRPGQTLSVGDSDNSDVPIHDRTILNAIKPGDRLLLGDGNVELKCMSGSDGAFTMRAVSGGLVKSKQGVTVVGRVFDTPSLTEKDLEDIKGAAEVGADYVALSYVRHAADMRELRRVVEKYDPKIKLCAKIETRDALKEIEDIVRVSDLVMVARGDMGLQMDLEEVPLAQKKIISKCLEAGKPVITATQMLESMINAPRPTRAEVTDIANAILDGTDAVMLSAETAAGQYPMEAVRYMARIAEKAETSFDYGKLIREYCHDPDEADHTLAVAFGVVQVASLVRPKAIVTTTSSGYTARSVSRFRPKAPILCVTWDERVERQMAVVWGVEAAHMDMPQTTDEQIQNAIESFMRLKRLKVGDFVVISAGVPAGMAGNTNLIMTQVVK